MSQFRMTRCLAVAAVLATFVLTGRLTARGDDRGSPALPPAASIEIDFARDVQPILAAHCHRCHGPRLQKSDYRLDTRNRALAGGSLGGAIVPGSSAASRLIHYVARTDWEIRMPPSGSALTSEQVGILRAWIDQGVPWAASPEEGAPAETPHWALAPLRRPPVPDVRGAEWVRTPIDAFVLARLEEKGLEPAPRADRPTLIRRLSFDLTGLPPRPEDVEEFVRDDSPGAWDKLVDRLLSSPEYGERWARHWMDVVHYAETHGHDEDAIRPHAWPYRDYLIRAFNEDRPYARFVEEQVAGDAVYPADPQATVATAFLAVGPWDESSQMGIQDGTIDKAVARYLDRDDMLATAMSTFTSSTVHCARCHDHKFDPISQEDYYSLQAVFAGVDRADRPYDIDPAVHAARRALLLEQAELSRPEVSRDVLLAPDVQSLVQDWERELSARDEAWTVLEPESWSSIGGSEATRLGDGSLLYSGERPERDTYTIIARTSLEGIRAVRLEVFDHETLPARGPGRADNGNLHLSEFRLSVAPLAGSAPASSVRLVRPRSDFDQSGWTVAMGIDGKPESAWGIHPRQGESHVAVFECEEPVGFAGGTALTFVLEQRHGGGHLIGRPRLSVTVLQTLQTGQSAGRAADELAPLPGEITTLLAVSPGERTDAQRSDLALFFLRRRNAEKLAALPEPRLVYAAASYFAPQGNFKPAITPRPVSVLRRGSIHEPLRAAEPGALSCVEGLEARFPIADPRDEASRRAALARWISDARNVLTWRSIANRVWHYHFGRGIAATPNDFGRMGEAPSHPELLDWLAAGLLQHGGSLKWLHREILTSSTYAQSCRHDPEFARVDAENRYLWRMNRGRLDAESLRDAVLAASGKLDRTMGGPSVKQFLLSPGVHITPNVNYLDFDPDDAANFRRGVYRFVFRTLPDPFMEVFDCPDASQLTPRRSDSVTAQQSLALLNSGFVVRQSAHLARRLEQLEGEPSGRIELLYRLLFSRPPSAEELRLVSAYAEEHGLENACRILLNTNEFLFVN